MTIIFRTDGAWGTGLGVNLSPAQVDGNFWDLQGRLTNIEDNPVEPIEPISITIAGSQFSMGLSNGETLGPITMTMPVPLWRGAWMPSTLYHEMDYFTAPDGGFGVVMVGHTSAATFDWAATSGGVPVYQTIVGASGTTAALGDLVDVSLTGEADGDLLVFNLATGFWQNRTKAVVATTILPPFGGDSGTGGLRGMVPAPAAGDAAAGKVLGAGGGWIVPAGGTGGSSSLAGLSDVSIVAPANLSLLQYQSSDGKWHNRTLATLGAGTVTSVASGAGLAGGPITTTGTLFLAQIGALNLLANVTGSPASPSGVTLSILLDAVLGSGRGSILRRDATTWSVLAPGTAGQYLKTGGTGADVSWDAPVGSGTVTQVNTGAGLSGGPITATGTVLLAPIADGDVLANVSGTTAPPAATTVTLLLDHTLGTTQGQILYRGATAWVALLPGTAGQVLTTGGAAANPAWAAAAGGSISIGDTPPASPSPGALWWDSVAGQLYIRYNDGSSQQWVVSNQPSALIGPAGGDLGSTYPNPTVVATHLAAPLPVAQGGTATSTAFTPGSVVFAGAAGAYTQSNAQLFWDNTNTRLGIGTATPAQKLDVTGRVAASLGFQMPANQFLASGTGNIYNDGGGTWLFHDAQYYFQNAGATATYAIFNSGGTANVTGAWTTISDRELKQDMTPYTRGLDAIAALNPIQFRYRSGTPFAPDEVSSSPLIGLIADEVEPHLPELVGKFTDDKGHTIATLTPGNLVYALVNAVKELSAEIESLKQQVTPGTAVL